VLEYVISLETFPFVERHDAELANVPSFGLFLVNCTNTALPSRILRLAIFTLHILSEDIVTVPLCGHQPRVGRHLVAVLASMPRGCPSVAISLSMPSRSVVV
jgi:hypothetical protein